MTESDRVSPETCAAIRQEYSFTDGIQPLREEFDIDPQELRAHLYGDCAHDIDEAAVTPPVEKRVSREECAAYRQKATDTPIAEIAEAAGQTRKTVARHAFGRCSHDLEISPAEPLEGVVGEQISSGDCEALRREYRNSDYETVLDFSTEYEVRYETVLRHLRGRCRHEDAEPPVEGSERAVAEVSQSTCAQMREAWRADPTIEFNEVTDEFSVSAETAERHIKFNCHHEYETVPAEEMDIFADYFQGDS